VLANNQLLAWGAAGLLETLETLAGAGIAAAGAGPDLRAARAPAVLKVGEKGRVLIFAAGATDSGIPRSWTATAERPGVNLLPDLSNQSVLETARLVRALKRPGDIAVASIHWGANWGFDISAEHRRFAHALIDRASIDVVHGHSSHHAKGIEIYQERPIFYGCGDFLDDYEGISGYEEYRGDLVLMYFPTLDHRTGRLARLEVVPLQIRNFRLHYPAPSDRAWIRETLDRECRRFGHQVILRDQALEIQWE
jgi:poly-gamma-glutamate synthesis protein (capsule biosynthesis protein)